MDEAKIREFWNSHPCGDSIVGGLNDSFAGDYDRFFDVYDAWRYRQESHIPACLDQVEWSGREVLEIGLGQGCESEQIIRRGARWSGLDLTDESISRVTARLIGRSLPYDEMRQGSVVSIPWPDDSFDIVFSHGVLHHVPQIHEAQREIHRVLRPGGMLVAMLYARNSLNFQVSIRFLRRSAVLAAFLWRRSPLVARLPILQQHLDNAADEGLWRYLELRNFTHHNTNGPENPFVRVYTMKDVARDFPGFTVHRATRHYMHAPPLPVHGWPGASRLGWHLWLHLRPRGDIRG